MGYMATVTIRVRRVTSGLCWVVVLTIYVGLNGCGKRRMSLIFLNRLVLRVKGCGVRKVRTSVLLKFRLRCARLMATSSGMKAGWHRRCVMTMARVRRMVILVLCRNRWSVMVLRLVNWPRALCLCVMMDRAVRGPLR